jgi:methyl-accepting chemotaxis protein
VTKVTELVGEIATACSEQAHGINQINSGLQQVDQVTQANTANAEETASAAEELTSQAAHVKQALGSFKLRNSHLMAGGTEMEGNITVVDSDAESTSGWGSVIPRPDNESDGFIALDDEEFGKF